MKTDEQLQKKVVAELQGHTEVNTAKIGIAVNNGIVTLHGRVDSYTKKIEVAEAVRHVDDVKMIIEDISVRLVPGKKRTDREIAQAAISALKQNHSVQYQKMKVAVKNGWLTLRGHLGWPYSRETAIDTVKDIAGLKGVTDLTDVTEGLNIPGVAYPIQKNLNAARI